MPILATYQVFIFGTVGTLSTSTPRHVIAMHVKTMFKNDRAHFHAKIGSFLRNANLGINNIHTIAACQEKSITLVCRHNTILAK
jgi:hypothetical protein